ncbi:MAG: choice-of-anchor P family protein [Solirubrobacteraceae bacterium]
MSVLVALAALSVGVSAGEAQAATGFAGNGYGTYANVGNTVLAGPSAFVALGCTTATGIHHTNTVASVNIPNLAATGAVNTTADSIAITGGVESRTTADVAQASLLSGRIRASEVKAVSTTSQDLTGLHVSAAGSSFTSLVVNGMPISATPPPNTTIALPGVGKVVLNEQIKSIGVNGAYLIVNMIHVYVTSAQPKIAAGTQIVVAHAYSALTPNVAGTLDGFAYGSYAHTGSLVTAGYSAAVYMPCQGTNGRLITNSVASVSISKVGTTGTVTDTALGTDNATTDSGETTSTVQNVNLLSGLVKASTVKADAHAAKTAGAISLTDIGSTFVNLVINGKSYSSNVPPNTKVSVGNITIYLHRVLRTANSIEVRMIDIFVTGSNGFGLPIGTEIRVADAEASAH